MHPEIQKKISELHTALKEHATKETVTFRLFVSCEEVRVEMSTRTLGQLQSSGISMRNIAGVFI